MKKSLFGLGIALIALVIVAGNVMAQDPLTRDDSTRVTVAQNFVGDFLEGHLYTTESNYSTKIKIINTSTTMAVVGHLVFRSGTCSVEVLDFPVFLTPTDVFEATLTVGANGLTQIFSDDDSVLADSEFVWNDNASCVPVDLVWANEKMDAAGNIGWTQSFYTDTINAFCPGDTTRRGHFEFYGTQAWRASAPLSKDVLALVSGSLRELTGTLTDAERNEVNAYINDCNISLQSDFGADVPNVLTGTITVMDSFYDQSTTLNMVALKNYESQPFRTFANAVVDLNRTRFNSVAEIEAAFSKRSFAVPFDFTGDTRNVINTTFPTHYLRVNNALVVPYESDYSVLTGYGYVNADVLPNIGYASYIRQGNKYNWLVGLKSTGLAAIGESVDVSAYNDFTSNADFAIDHNGVCGMAYLAYDMQEKVLIDYLSGDLFRKCLDEVTMQSMHEHMRPDLLAAGYEKGWLNVIYPQVMGLGFATADAQDTDGPYGPLLGDGYDYFVGYTGAPSINTYMTFSLQGGDMSWNFAPSPEDEGVFYWDVNPTADVDGDGIPTYHVRQ